MTPKRSDLVFEVRFASVPRFSGRTPEGRQEWPPAPARLFAALVAGAHALGRADCVRAREALAELERTPAPVIFHPAATPARPISAFSQKHAFDPPGRKASASTLRRYLTTPDTDVISGRGEIRETPPLHPHGPLLSYLVPDVGHLAEALDLAASGISTFGRSTDAAAVSARPSEVDEVDAADGNLVSAPSSHPGPTRVWARGYLDALDRRHALSTCGAAAVRVPHPDDVTPSIRYITGGRRSPTDDTGVVVLPLDKPLPARRIAETMGRVAQTLGDLPVEAFPAVFADLEHGDGSLRGVGLAVRYDGQPQELYASAVNALLSAEIPVVADLTLGHGVWTTPDLYTRSATTWRSVTPVRSVPDQLIAATEAALAVHKRFDFDPDEVLVDVVRVGQTAAHGSSDTIGHDRGMTPGLVGWHVRIETPVAVPGPLRVGHDLDFGAGLLVPGPASPHERKARP